MNDKIPSTTEAESAGFPPYGTGLFEFHKPINCPARRLLRAVTG
jgi:hypothetical protein